MARRTTALLLALAGAMTSGEASAFPYVVQRGDTLASIAERFYGRIQHEKVLVAANALDAQGGSPIVPGMRLEVPAVAHHKVKKGETWAKLALTWLGASHRSDVFAIANGTSPWLPPEDGAEIAIPYNLQVFIGSGDTIVTVAYEFMGDMNKAWVLDHYNALKGRRLQRGDVVLVPLTDLALTDEGKATLKESAALSCSEAAGDQRQAQRKVAAELPALLADVRGGRYVDAVTRANQFLSTAALTEPQLAQVHRQLLEAYAALEAPGLAAKACKDWRTLDKSAELDPIMMSPKLIAACSRGTP